MAITVNVSITTHNVWVEVITGAVVGVASVTGGGQYYVSSTAPVDTFIGHRFTGELVPFTLEVGEALYVRGDTVNNVVMTLKGNDLSTYTTEYTEEYV
jgi:hypothetical protein